MLFKIKLTCLFELSFLGSHALSSAVLTSVITGAEYWGRCNSVNIGVFLPFPPSFLGAMFLSGTLHPEVKNTPHNEERIWIHCCIDNVSDILENSYCKKMLLICCFK